MNDPVTKAMAAAISVLVLASVLALASGAHAEQRMARCYLSVDGRAYLDQTCIFDADKDGSFSIGTAGANGTVRMPFFAYVNKNLDGGADGYWNEDASSTHAQAPLGALKRAGASWLNKRAKVFAY